MNAVILDTDVVSEVLKQRNPAVIGKAAAYLRAYGQFTFSAFTRFEIIRGYKEKAASTQLGRFHAFCQHSVILPVTDAIFDRASDLWAAGRGGGHPTGDADLIIAATAMEQGLELVTGNTAHYAWIHGLAIADWRTP